jgi:hypothetical protein
MKRFFIILLVLLAFPLLHSPKTHAQGPPGGTFTCTFTTSGCNIINNCVTGYTTNANLCPANCISTGPIACVSGNTPIPYSPNPWYDQTPSQFHDRVFGTPLNPVPENEIFGERYTYAQINWIINSLANILSFRISTIQDLIDRLQPLLNTSTPPSFSEYAQLGIPGILIGGISEIYTHPAASGSENIQRTMAKLNLAQPVSAQGVGFTTTSALNFLWSASRNTAYLIMVILLVASGFLIMFRVKVNPQTVVSIQLMIPKLIVTLVLVTFSFAISGLIIDLIYLIIGFLLAAFSQTGVFSGTSLENAVGLFTGPNFRLILAYFIVPTILTLLASAAIIALGFASASVTSVLGITAAIGGTIAALITIILLVAICWILFKLYWMLLKSYVQLLLQIIIGPWQIMLGILPGQAGFSTWFRNMISLASVFVVTPMMLLFTMVFWSPFTNVFAEFVTTNDITALEGIFAPLGIINSGGGEFPILPVVGGGGAIFSFIIGYACLALTPKIADMVRDALKVPAFKYGNAIGQPLGLVRGPAQAGASAYTDYLYPIARRPGDPANIVSGAIDTLRYAGVVKGKPGA